MNKFIYLFLIYSFYIRYIKIMIERKSNLDKKKLCFAH